MKKNGFMFSDVLFAIAGLILCMYLTILISSSYTKNLSQIKHNIYIFDEIKNKLVYKDYISEKLDMNLDVEDEIVIGDTKIYIKTLTVKENGNVKKEYKILQK